VTIAWAKPTKLTPAEEGDLGRLLQARAAADKLTQPQEKGVTGV